MEKEFITSFVDPTQYILSPGIPQMPENPTKIRVLLVEERGLIQAALTALIDAADGLQVVAAVATSVEAIELAERLQPDILLMGSLSEWGVFGAVSEIIERCPRTRVILLDERMLDANARKALRVRSSRLSDQAAAVCADRNRLAASDAGRPGVRAADRNAAGAFGRGRALDARHFAQPVGRTDAA